MNHLPHTLITVCPHKHQTYNTAGNYNQWDNYWLLEVSELPDWRMEAAIVIHEFVEMCLTKHRGISWDDITRYDTVGNGKDSDDPGANEDAPYHKEHTEAERLERLFCDMIGIEWDVYNKALDALEY